MKRNGVKKGRERGGEGETMERRLQVLIVLTSEEVRSRLDSSSGPTPLASIFLQLHLPFPCKDNDWIRREKSQASRETLQKFDISGTSISQSIIIPSSVVQLANCPLSLYRSTSLLPILASLFVAQPIVELSERNAKHV